MTKQVLTVGILFSLLFMRGCEQVARAESEIVLQTIAMESANQQAAGQVAVASVIINRARVSNRSMEAICRAPRQFSCWNDPKWASRWISRHFDSQTRLRALTALERARNAGNRHVTHYHTRDITPYWAKGHSPVIVEGNHAFYSDIH